MMLCVLLAALLFCTVRGASTGGCGRVPTVPHAIPLSSDTSIGTKVRYNCNEGYIHTGRRTKNTCRRGGWTDNVICSPDVGCDNPNHQAAQTYIRLPTIPGQKYPVGTVGDISCNPGFEWKRGDIITTCYLEGTKYGWTDYDTECRPRLCGDAGRPHNGERDSDANRMGAQVRFHCNTGYSLVGDSIRTCLADGTWTNHVPTCRLNCCGQLQGPSDGSVRHNGDNCYGDTATVTCNKGYSIIEPPGTSVSITCTSNGQWSTPVPTCIQTPCATPQHVPNGRVAVSGNSYADFIHYECNATTTTRGETYGQCMENGEWTIPPPNCLAHCPEYRLENGINHYKSDLGHVPHGTNRRPSCRRPRYELSRWCSTVTCNNGTWTGCPDDLTCIPAPCPYKPGSGGSSARGDDGKTYYENDRIPSGTTVTILCTHGYEDGQTATCSYGVLPTTYCTKKRCSLPDSIGTTYSLEVQRWNSDTTMEPVTEHVVYNDVVHISCSGGYRSSQTHTRCDAGTFNPPLEICEELFCLLPTIHFAAPSNIKVKYQHRDVITIQCIQGYRSQTNLNEYTCDNEKWTPRPPVDCTDRCIIPSLQNTFFGTEGGYLSSRQTVANGIIVTMSCHNSYKPVHPSSVCLKGFLDPTPEKCISMHCVKPNLSHGTTLNPSKYRYTHNDQVEIDCNTGFALPENAPSVVTCNDTHLSITQCEEVFCQKPPISNAVFGEDSRYRHGQTVDVSCKSGYRLEGSARTTCRDGAWTDTNIQCKDNCLIPSYESTSFLSSGTSLNPGQTVANGAHLTISCSSDHNTTTQNYTCNGGRLIPEPTACVLALTTPIPSSNNEGQRFITSTSSSNEGANKDAVDSDNPDDTEVKQPGSTGPTTPKPPNEADNQVTPRARSCQRADTDELKFEYGNGRTVNDHREQFTCLNKDFAIGEDAPHNQHNYVRCVDGSFVPTPECRDTIPLATPTTLITTKKGDQDIAMVTTETTSTAEVTSRSSSCHRLNINDYKFDYPGLTANGTREGYSCTKTGYTAVGEDDENREHNYVRCRNGQFEPRPYCKAPPCEVPVNTRYMGFQSTGTVNAGELVRYQCLDGATARNETADDTSTCSDGKWHPKPLCNPKGCDRGMKSNYGLTWCCKGDVLRSATLSQDWCIEECYETRTCQGLQHDGTMCTLYRSCAESWGLTTSNVYRKDPSCG